MELLKTPYEISLWDDKTVWVRRALEGVNVAEEEYEPGKYFSQTPTAGTYGSIPFTIDYNDYNETQKYYSLNSKVAPIEGDDPDEVKLGPGDERENGFRAIYVNKFDNDETYYTYVSKTDTWQEVTNDEKGKGPVIGTIYFKRQDDYLPMVFNSYFKEYKKCVLGADNMTSPARAVNGKLVSKVNGENTLTFTMYYKYWNVFSQSMEKNPLTDASLLCNERKIKLRIGKPGDDCEWYDLVVKQIQENSDQKTFTYTCKDQFINELSKTGFEIELDNELGNNMGTVEFLAENILEGSDWEVLDKNSDLKQYVEEPLYEVILGEDITATEMVSGKSQTFPAGETIHVFYSQLTSRAESLQFLYNDTENFFADDDMIIDKNKYDNYVVKVPSYNGNGIPEWADQDPDHLIICPNYRGMRLVRQAATLYDPTIGKYVSVYTKNEDGTGEEYYGFTKTEYLSPKAVINFLTNSSSFTNTNGWIGEKTNTDRPTFSIATYPALNRNQSENGEWFSEDIKTYLQIGGALSTNTRIMNSAIGAHRSRLASINKGDKWVLRIKYKVDNITGDYKTDTYPVARLNNYTIDANGGFSPDANRDAESAILNFNNWSPSARPNDTSEKQNYIYMMAQATKSVSESELKNLDNRFALCIGFPQASNYDHIYIEDAELFPYVEYISSKDNATYFCVPNGEFFSETRTDYYYYTPDATLKDYSELEPEVVSQGKPAEGFYQKYRDNGFVKIRSISAKESNRFNLIQDLCEKFECWARFVVSRDMMTGEIKLGKDDGKNDEKNAFRQQKYVVFRQYANDKYNWAGFRYGVNSKSISRSLDSASIVSKMIVKNNANEFAPNGFCTISRAQENPTKENFVLNFDHYYRHNLLSLATVTNDLYLTTGGYLGYYTQLSKMNEARDELISIQSNALIDIAHYEAQVQTYKASYDAAIEEKIGLETYIKDLTGYSLGSLLDNMSWTRITYGPSTTEACYSLNPTTGEYERVTNPKNGYVYYMNPIYARWDEDRSFLSAWAKYCQAQAVIQQHGEIYREAESNLADVQAEYNTATAKLEKLAEQKRALNLRFYKKYARFLQEGSWIKEDYVDDNLYYLDSLSTLHASAQPKVSYTINVLDISTIPAYKNYRFKLGERTYVEDTEFFGYSLKDGRPRKEEVVVSEITRELDSPEKNTIKVQNYKTQFEDLFQRITATTQSIEYHTGEYQRASNIVEEDGAISAESLELSISKNSVILSKTKDQSVLIDDNGITTTCVSNPSKMVRIVDGGIFLSMDGGETWRTGITAAGVNSSILTTGQLNTDDIVITNQGNPSFRWNSQGINAFGFRRNGSYEPAKFVRFDHYGIYGVNGTLYDQFNPDKPGRDGKTGEDRIWNEAQYALTWKGFMLRRQSEDGGQVTISSADDIVVSAKNNEGILKTRIQIGDINKALVEAEIVANTNTDPIYGIYIADKQGKPVMTSMDDGQLWLRQALRVGVSDASTVTIGYGKEETETTTDENGEKVEKGTGHHEIVYAGKDSNSFVVYDDGRMKATGATITGHIEAKSGKIGNMTIGDVETTVEQSKKLDIQPKMGYNFKVGSTISPEQLEFDVVGVGIKVDNDTPLEWTLTDFGEKSLTKEQTGLTIKISYEDFEQCSSNNTAYLEVKILGDDQHKALAQIMAVADGGKGEDAYVVIITSTNGNFFKNGSGETTLEARVFQGGVEVGNTEADKDDYSYVWSNSTDPDWHYYEKTLPVTAGQVYINRTYWCEVSKGGT